MFKYNHSQLFNPLLKALKQHSGPASVRKLEESVAELMGLTEDELNHIHQGNRTKFQYRLAWARTCLKIYGLIENTARTMWALTAEGQNTSEVDPEEVLKKVNEKDAEAKAAASSAKTSNGETDTRDPSSDGFSLLTAGEDIGKAYKLFKLDLDSNATKSKKKLLGTRGGKFEVDFYWFSDLDFWISTDAERLENRFSNTFGLGNPFNNTPSPIVELNPSREGINRSCAGAFLTDEAGNYYLAHTGRPGGGKKGVTQEGFLKFFKKPQVAVGDDKFLNLGKIGEEGLLANLKEFVVAIRDFKASVSSKVPRPDSEDQVRYWDIHAGTDNRWLEEFYELGQISIPWDYLGDLKQYSSKAEIREKIKEREKLEKDPRNKALACHCFANEMKVGDHIFVKESFHTVLAHGIVTSDYIHDDSRPADKNVRKVNWLQKGRWPLPKDRHMDRKKLTELTAYPEYVEYFLKLVSSATKERTIAEAAIVVLDEGKSCLPVKEIYDRVLENELYEFRTTQPLKIFKDGLWRHLAGSKIKTSKFFYKDEEGRYGLLKWLDKEPEVSIPKAPVFNRETLLSETLFPEAVVDRWLRAINRKRRAVFYGPPGTGKTYVAERIARHLVSETTGFLEVVQFHPAYSYEDFIQGIRPTPKNGHLEYPVVDGCFLEFCDKAKGREGPCVLIIDEINRADLSRVFGELMYVLEDSSRQVKLASGQEFRIPENVIILGTMNTADRSIAVVDHALRRRFAFIPLYPDYSVLKRFHSHRKTGAKVDGLIGELRKINKEIDDRRYEIGVSFFMTEELETDLEDIWIMEIEPYLEEYFFDRPKLVDTFRWVSIATKLKS